MTLSDLGKNIKYIRKQRCVSQEQLAIQAGMSRATLSKPLYTMIFHIFSSRVVLPNIFRQSLNSFVEKPIFEMALTIISKPYLK